MTGHPAVPAAFISAPLLSSELEDPRAGVQVAPSPPPSGRTRLSAERGMSSPDSAGCSPAGHQQLHGREGQGHAGRWITAQLNTDQSTNAVQSTKMTHHHPPDSELTATSSFSTALSPRITNAGHRRDPAPCWPLIQSETRLPEPSPVTQPSPAPRSPL